MSARDWEGDREGRREGRKGREDNKTIYEREEAEMKGVRCLWEEETACNFPVLAPTSARAALHLGSRRTVNLLVVLFIMQPPLT